ncbi:MBL fold metallo-hydrolase [Brevibacillus choshinensis]|uniref:MBL fold metallo-hydrolase n=1 Tax=Brevibacillus choshinensis TaxID=54911 RepID=A0ABX7FUY6_BRECH|nr:MBL fold metallo-hydrolase [Brevibacillus choshinensis]QRG68800.1 MBL fold metallo-hydrolase [Brevibacillus choshinensis]
MNIQRLPWAGIRISSGDFTIAIDPVSRIPEKFGKSREPMYPLEYFGKVDAVLVTHLHDDHFDPAAITATYGASVPVYVPAEVADTARAAGLTNVIGADVGTTYKLGNGVTATAAPSVDGVGDVQIAWIVEGADHRVIHCGDTLWHGYWWKIAQTYGPFHAAFLPVNGAVLELPGRMPSAQPICLTPEQAVSAAAILGAEMLIPIHYGAVHYPPIYTETPDIVPRLTAAAEGKVKLSLLKPTETLAL